MRLKSIKLAGFKSFVDPTKVELLSNRVAIVGPNGCGKSNIIDAVRWVMGESSAKQLRGESLVDVIFNGSTHRSPISQASIELHFDNSDGTLGGEYASYHDIVIRRQVTRDGQSTYALNGSRCRRKDITDIFLGTGLGPRSYAIIEQGTISRLIEAKPDELRIFLEEAAGISKYKERRKETESRLSNTRDNLDRLNDIRDELTKQIAHLDRQAKAAERFKNLKIEERGLKAQLLALKSELLKQELALKLSLITTEQDRLTGLQTEIAQLEAGMSERIDQQENAQNALNEIQQNYMEQGAEVARLEQNIHHAQQRYQQIQEDLRLQAEQMEHAQALQQRDEQRRTVLQEQLGALAPDLSEKSLTLDILQEQLTNSEQSAQQVQTAWDQLNQHLLKASQLAQQKQHELQKREQQHQHLLEQSSRLTTEKAQVELSLNNLSAPETDTELALLQEQQYCAEQALTDVQALIETSRATLAQARGDVHQTQQQLTAQKAQLTGLETYQAQALKRSTSISKETLTRLGLDQAKPLIDLLEVEPGFEKPIEILLGHWLQALCVPNLSPITEKLQDTQKQALWLVALEKTTSAVSTSFTSGISLATKVKGPQAIVNLLAHAYLIDDNQAIPLDLNPSISLITDNGVLHKAGLLQCGQPAEDGVLERQRHMHTCLSQIDSLTELLSQHQATLSDCEINLNQLEQTRAERQQQWQQISQRTHQQESVVQIRVAKQQQLTDRLRGITQQLAQAETDARDVWQAHESLRDAWQIALHELELLNSQKDATLAERDLLRENMLHCRSQWQTLQSQVHQLNLQQQQWQTEKTALDHQVARTAEQYQQLTQRHTTLSQTSLEVLEPLPLWKMQVETLLEQRFEQEQHLQAAKIKVQHLSDSFKQSEHLRREVEAKVEAQRSTLDAARLNAEALQARWQSIQEQMQEAELDREALSLSLTPELSEGLLQQSLDEVAQKIQRLGLVNLAAIEEFETQSARKTYLDTQHQDLIEAMGILENAIRTIDRETKARFSETFEQVNQNFQTLFPRVFAGGKAYLELTGDDLLSTGVAVFAQPPGKRNSTIHLLSGGEKALTAVALVFAIFQINPAPFCMLDEVDAPLDDANVTRFCHLVNLMADKTQFIMVTHNKVAMEMADQLMGVTMQEPGVSRLVAVDMNDALAMVN